MKKLYLQAPGIPKSGASEALFTPPEKICDQKADFSMNFRGDWDLAKHKICIGPAPNNYIPYFLHEAQKDRILPRVQGLSESGNNSFFRIAIPERKWYSFYKSKNKEGSVF